jgi:Prp8 binding protein
MHFSTDGDLLFTASTDKSIMIWDSQTGARIKKLSGHQSIVNCCHPSRRSQLLCSGSDDCNIRLWDIRKRGLVSYFKDNYQITAITFNDTSDQIIASGIENVLKVYDLRKNDILYTMAGHFDTVTGLSLSPDGNYVLSNSMDNSRESHFILLKICFFSCYYHLKRNYYKTTQF